MNLTELFLKYDGLLIDAYGVLVHSEGAYAAAPETVNWLNINKHPYLIVTNDASRLPSTITSWFSQLGMEIPEDQVTSSGSMLGPYFEKHQLVGKNTIVLGTEDSIALGAFAGAKIISPHSDKEIEVVIVGDEKGFPLLEYCDLTLTKIIDAFDRGKKVHLIIPNPDTVYPKINGFGLAAGAVSLMLEEALHAARPKCDWAFTSLGKPRPNLFENAFRLLGSKKVLMIGDQLTTDILGANEVGIDSLLVMSGVAKYEKDGPVQPTFIVDSFSMDAMVEVISNRDI